MKPTLEQIKTDESVWPEGATHYIGDLFTMWSYGDEYRLMDGDWKRSSFNWPLRRYKKENYKIIPRPAKAFVPEVGEWCEWKTQSMDWSDAFYIGCDSNGNKCFHNRDDKMFFVPNGVGIYRPIKTERAVLLDIIEATGNMPDGVLADNILNAGFTKEPAK